MQSPDTSSELLTTFLDNGTTCHILNSIAKQRDLTGNPVSVVIKTINGPKTRDTMLYNMTLQDQSQKHKYAIWAFGIENIFDVLPDRQIGGVKKMFPRHLQDL